MNRPMQCLPGLLTAAIGLILQSCATETTTYNIEEFGARGDGKTVNTSAIQRAVDRCSKSGGTVLVPSGVFVTGTIRMKSNTVLHLGPGAVLRGSAELEDYPFHGTSHPFGNDSIRLRTMLLADGAQNIGITGSGTIDGNGAAPAFDLSRRPRPQRPIVVRFISCRNVQVESVRMVDAPMWMQQYVNCTQLTVRNIRVHSFVNRNNDGLDIVGCSDVLIQGCIIQSDDDAICLKTLSGAMNENVVISECIVASNCNGIKIGTETMADMRNIVVSNCIVRNTGIMSPAYARDTGISGLAIESVDGAVLENILISNVTATGVNAPLFMRLGNRGRRYSSESPEPPVGKIRDVRINHFTGVGKEPYDVAISGIPGHEIEKISLSHVTIVMPGGAGVGLTEFTVPEDVAGYPRPQMFGDHLPAYGMYVRHVRGLAMHDVVLRYASEDARPGLVLDDVSDLTVDGFRAMGNLGSQAVVRLINTSDVFLRGISLIDAVPCFLLMEGKDSQRIKISGSRLRPAKNKFVLANGAVVAPSFE